MFIFSNLATSLDGKIATVSRVHFPLGTPLDRKRMIALRRRCDAVIMGATTIRAYRRPCRAGRARVQPWNVVVSSALEGLSTSWDFFTAADVRRLLFVTTKARAATIARFRKVAEVVVLKPPGRAGSLAAQIVRELRRRGLRRLLVEGGGSLMWDFASENLIDEYYVTLTPRIVGGGDAPTLVDGEGFEPSRVLNLKLVRCRRAGDELYLVYQKIGRKTARRGP